MKAATLVIGATGASLIATSALAGAWVQPKGRAQVIVKAEAMEADMGFDPSGAEQPLPAPQRDNALGVFAEYGLTDRLTVQIKGEWQSGEDAFVDYDGRGPVEIGLTWQAWRDDRAAVSLYGGYAEAGDGRNAAYAPPGVGERDWEARASVGRSFGRPNSRMSWAPDRSFVELQAARRIREGLPDETRVDFTAGAHFGERWLVLGQAYGGAADGGSRWLSAETSVVRNVGSWSVQAGWRQTVAGRETPVSRGPVLAVWKRF